MKINIYCDESGHLEKDQARAMALGAIWCPANKSKEIAVRMREIKAHYGLSPHFEAKWGKISPAQINFYIAILDYFFDDDDLNFRGIVVADKTKLDHARYEHDHDTWYYKMYFLLLRALISPENEHYIYLDIKDTQGGHKVRRLHEVLTNNAYDFNHDIIKKIQILRSHQVEQIQLADLLTGAIAYANKGLDSSPAKVAFVERLKERSGHNLHQKTLLQEEKFNLLMWEGSYYDRD